MTRVVPGSDDVEKREDHDRPLYYKLGVKIEVWDAIEDWGLGFLDGNVVKYVARFRHKGAPIKDLKKARTYLDKLISVEEQRIKARE